MLNKCATVLGLLACLSGRQDVNSVRSEIVDSPTAQRAIARISNIYDWITDLQQKKDVVFEEITVPDTNAFAQNDERCERSLSEKEIEDVFSVVRAFSPVPCTVYVDKWNPFRRVSCKEALSEIDRMGDQNGPDSKITRMLVKWAALPFYWAQDMYPAERVEFESISISDALRVIKLVMEHVENLKQDDPLWARLYDYDMTLEEKINFMFEQHARYGRPTEEVPMPCKVRSVAWRDNEKTKRWHSVYLDEPCDKAKHSMLSLVRNPDVSVDLKVCKMDKHEEKKRSDTRCADFHTGSLFDALMITAIVEEQTKK